MGLVINGYMLDDQYVCDWWSMVMWLVIN